MDRILHIITGLGLGGAETMLAKLIGGSACYRHEVLSLTGKGEIGPRLEAMGVKVDTLDLDRAGRWITALPRLRALVRAQRPDLIQGWLNHGNLAALAAKFLARTDAPAVWNVRQSLGDMRFDKWRTRQVIRINARLSRRPAAILYNSVAGARDHEAIGYAPEKTVLIPNGFDLDRFLPLPGRRSEIRRSLGVGEDEVLIGLIARFDHWKNHGAFFAAASAILAGAPESRFLLAGDGMVADNPALRALIRDPLVLERSLLLGRRTDMPELNAALDIACNVSHGEGFPNAIGEAMAAAVPCVVSTAGDMAAIVGEGGIVAGGADADDIAAAVHALISMGSEGRAQMGDAGRKRIAAHFSLPAIVARYETIYADLLMKAGNERTQGWAT
jgi:glycosyltransferase involved in cell wall biosynthesis